MELWNNWGLPLALVIAAGGVAFIATQLVGRWLDGQEHIAEQDKEADKQ
jgi:hypothetical protein